MQLCCNCRERIGVEKPLFITMHCNYYYIKLLYIYNIVRVINRIERFSMQYGY